MLVAQQGLYGERAPPDPPRPFHEALPTDTLRLRPFVVDRDGPIEDEELSARWIACPTVGCLASIAEVDRLQPCSLENFERRSACLAGDTPEILVTLPDFPPTLDETGLFTLTAAPSIALLAARKVDGGAEACARRLGAREPLGNCVMMLRDVEIGPLGELADAAEQAGIMVDVGRDSEALLDVPRNLAPFVERFVVSGSSVQDDGEVDSRGTFAVAVDDEIEIAYRPSDLDYDGFEITLDDGEVLEFDETLTGRWWISRPAVAFASLDLRARWTVSGEPGTTHVYFVVRDGRGSEAWGWIVFEVRQ